MHTSLFFAVFLLNAVLVCAPACAAGRWRGSMPVAVKKLTPGQMTTDDFVTEAKLLHRLRHRHLVLLLGVCTLDEPVYIIMELLPNGALNSYLHSDAGRKLPFSILVNFASQVSRVHARLFSRINQFHYLCTHFCIYFRLPNCVFLVFCVL